MHTMDMNIVIFVWSQLPQSWKGRQFACSDAAFQDIQWALNDATEITHPSPFLSIFLSTDDNRNQEKKYSETSTHPLNHPSTEL